MIRVDDINGFELKSRRNVENGIVRRDEAVKLKRIFN